MKRYWRTAQNLCLDTLESVGLCFTIELRGYTMNDRFKNILNEVVNDSVNSTRNRATYDGASAVERATFGKLFNVIEGVLALVALFGCFFISNATQNSQFLMYLLGLLWIIPFIVVGALLARFRHRVFVMVRGIMSNFLGGNRL